MLALLLLLGCPGPSPEPSDCDAPGTICTIAGAGMNGYNGQNLPATETWMYFPSALDWHPDGRLVINDYNNFLVRALEPDGTLSTLVGSYLHAYAVEGPALESPLENPVDIAFTEDERLLIAELHSGRILQVDSGGWLSIVAGTGEIGYAGDGGPAVVAELGESSGVISDGEGGFLIADTDYSCLRRVGADGIIRTAAGNGQAGLVDGVGGMLSGPQHMHRAGEIVYIADANNHAIRAYNLSTGELDTLVGDGVEGFTGDGGPAAQARLHTPWGMSTDPEGRLWIADSLNNRVRRVDADGTIHTLVGAGTSGYSGDGGPAMEAELNFPADLLFDDDGNLYIADMGNGSVRRVAGPLD